LEIFLGPVLKLLTGTNIGALWENASSALEWLNKKRNLVMHSGVIVARDDAFRGLYCVVRVLFALKDRGGLDPEFNFGLLNQLQQDATFSSDEPQEWLRDPLPRQEH
jgi:hypothetical protein